MRKIEVCCSSLHEAREAEEAGAIRIELCAAIGCGGVTPSHGTIEAIMKSGLKLDVNVLIRSREGGFCYTEQEIDTMCRDIEFCREMGVHGVVIGALTENGNTLKRLFWENEKPRLHAENKTYPKDKIDIYPSELIIQGIALKVVKDIR